MGPGHIGKMAVQSVAGDSQGWNGGRQQVVQDVELGMVAGSVTWTDAD